MYHIALRCRYLYRVIFPCSFPPFRRKQSNIWRKKGYRLTSLTPVTCRLSLPHTYSKAFQGQSVRHRFVSERSGSLPCVIYCHHSSCALHTSCMLGPFGRVVFVTSRGNIGKLQYNLWAHAHCRTDVYIEGASGKRSPAAISMKRMSACRAGGSWG